MWTWINQCIYGLEDLHAGNACSAYNANPRTMRELQVVWNECTSLIVAAVYQYGDSLSLLAMLI